MSTPPFFPGCSRAATIVDRYNKPLVCRKGESIVPDIWIQPKTNCPQILSARCSSCQSPCDRAVCTSYPTGPKNCKTIKSWKIKGKCCIPEIVCQPCGTSNASMPFGCNSCLCPFGGNPNNPDPFSVWEMVARNPSPGPFPPPKGPDAGPCGANWGWRCGVFVYSQPNCMGKIIGISVSANPFKCSPIYDIK